MLSEPGSAFASWIAARSVQVPAVVKQTPSPRFVSVVSLGSFTVNVALAVEVGRTVAVDDGPGGGVMVGVTEGVTDGLGDEVGLSVAGGGPEICSTVKSKFIILQAPSSRVMSTK